MNEEETLLEAMTRVRPEVLNEQTLKLYNVIMKVIDERDKLRKKYETALEVILEYGEPPCEKDNFMDKNTDYCSMKCGADEETFKKCWDRYIEQRK